MGGSRAEEMTRLSKRVKATLRYHYEHEPVEINKFAAEQGIAEESTQELLAWQQQGKRIRAKTYTNDEGEVYIEGIPTKGRKNRRNKGIDIESNERNPEKTERQKWDTKEGESNSWNGRQDWSGWQEWSTPQEATKESAN